MASDAPHFIANAIEHRLAQVGLHRADMAGLERVEPSQDVQHGLLNQIPGIEVVSRRRRQLAMRPPFQVWNAALQKRLHRLTVARLGANHQFDRRLVAEQIGLAFVLGWGTHGMQDACNDSGETSSVLLTVSGRDRTKCAKRALRAVYSADIPDMLGRTISHYRITGKLGTGGMGVVYEAEDTRLPRKVALKFLSDELADDPDAVRRFRREAGTIATLSHGHICTIYDIDEYDGRVFIAMECLEGVNLKTYMSRNTLTTARIADLSLQIASALGAAHAKGIVHRDIKPGNLIVSETGTVKVLDFGLARRFKTADTDELGPEGSTMPGRPMGTANYMAPERILQLPLDPRCDLFSLGVVMYEMATGRLPFAGASPSETVSNVLDKDPDPLTTLAPQHKALEPVVRRLLAKRASDRYSSVSELVGVLGPLVAPHPTLGERFRRLFLRS